MKNFLSILSILLACLFISCESETVEHAATAVSSLNVPPPPAYKKQEVLAEASAAIEETLEEEIIQAQNENEVNLIDRKIIKNGDVEFETSSVQATRNQILEQAMKLNAYIANDEEYRYEGRITNSITLRVPSKKFEQLLNTATEGVENFNRKEIRAEDVTEEFVDLEARIKSKVELETRYFELLKKAKNIKEMLEIETQLGELRTEIESMQGRLRYMKNSVSYSTLNIKFYQRVPIEHKANNEFAQGFKCGWDNVVSFFVWLITVWPFLIVGCITFIFIRRKYKKFRATK